MQFLNYVALYAALRVGATLALRSAVTGLLLAPFAARADGPEIVERVPNSPTGHIIWRITRPNVTKDRTDYPQITFTPGSRVTINASGCVQTGGSSKTWKRYVAPAGKNSETYYHGELLIPGIMSELKFFSPSQPVTYDLPPMEFPPEQNHLVLGYTDDHYSDNGYRSHDDGNSNQCKDVNDVVVLVDIEASPKPPPPPPTDASYAITIENVTIRKTRSRENDTDILGAGVIVDWYTKRDLDEAGWQLERRVLCDGLFYPD